MSRKYEREDWAGNKYWEDEDGNREYEKEDWAGNKYREDKDGNRTYEKEDWAGNKYEEKDDKNGGCFLTTACVQHAGLADNCHELECLRAFRDTYVRQVNGGSRLLEEYYATAPAIVSGILASDSSESELSSVYDAVKRAVCLIESGKEGEALECYKSLYMTLRKKYLTHEA